MTCSALVTVIVCAPSDTAIRDGFCVRLTSAAATQPALPLGRPGSSPSTKPSGRCDFTRNVCGTPVAGLLWSYSHGLGNCWLGAGWSGDENTPMLVTSGFTVAMNDMYAGIVVVVVGGTVVVVVVDVLVVGGRLTWAFS